MQKVNVSTKMMGMYAGKWVVIDPKIKQVVAVGKTLEEIWPLVTRPATDKRPDDQAPYSFLVPRKDEGPYI